MNNSSASPTFGDFWAAYPRKKGTSKDAAAKSWARACRTVPPEVIMGGLAAYPFNPEARFQPHAATWLNQARWVIEEDGTPPTVRREMGDREAAMRRILGDE